MITRVGSGWQTVLADLALILFMVTGSALSQSPNNVPPSATAGPSPRAEPVAVWHAGDGAPPLGKWLSAADPRARLTVTVRYGKAGMAPALDRARVLAEQAGARGLDARIVVEPGSGEDAVVAYDAPMLARGLQGRQAMPSIKE